MDQNGQSLCPSCHNTIIAEDYFCPHCGKKLKDKPLATSAGKQTIVYLVSVLLPPFGLPWAFRYLKQGDEKSKIIGYIVIGLTVLSLLVNVWLCIGFINGITKDMNTTLKEPLSSFSQ